MNNETHTIVYNGDIETITFIDRLEESLFQYFQLQGYNPEQIQQVDFRSNIHNSIIGLFRRCNLSPKELVEHLTFTTSLEATGELHGEYQQQWNETNLKLNNRITKLVQNEVES